MMKHKFTVNKVLKEPFYICYSTTLNNSTRFFFFFFLGVVIFGVRVINVVVTIFGLVGVFALDIMKPHGNKSHLFCNSYFLS